MQQAVYPLSYLRVKPIGVMNMIDQNQQDDKIICVHLDDPEYNTYTSISEIPKHVLAEVGMFFEDYKKLEKKKVKVDGFKGPEEAIKIVAAGMVSYQDYISNQEQKSEMSKSPTYRRYIENFFPEYSKELNTLPKGIPLSNSGGVNTVSHTTDTHSPSTVPHSFLNVPK